MQSLQFDQSQLAAVTQENEGLRKQVEQMEAEAKKWVMWSHSDDLAHDAPLCSHLVFINRNKSLYVWSEILCLLYQEVKYIFFSFICSLK